MLPIISQLNKAYRQGSIGLSLKMKRVWRRDYANQEEARRDVADYQKHLSPALGDTSPAEFERQCRLKPAPVPA